MDKLERAYRMAFDPDHATVRARTYKARGIRCVVAL